MNTIIPSQTQFMSSLEIAELTDKNHSHVVRDIRKLLSKLDEPFLVHEQYQELKDDRGYTKEFLLNKNLTLTLMTGYDVNTRHKINIRWQELEAKVAQPVFDISNPYHLLHAIETQAKQNIELSQKVEKLEPKALALDVLSQNKHGYLCLTDVAKHLHIKRGDLTNFMANLKLIYRRATSSITRKGKWAAYERAIKNGWLFHDYVAGEKPDGTDYAPQVLVTPKGLTYIAELISKELKVAS